MTRNATLAAAIIIGLAITTANGTQRGAICGQRQQVVLQQHAVLVPQPIYQYQVGQQLREDALAEKVAQLVLQKLEAAAAQQPAPNEGPQRPPQDDHVAAAQRLATKNCTSCHRHNGEDPEGVDLRNLAALSPLQGWAVFKQVYHGTMPKNGTPLQDDAVEAIMRWNIHR